MLQDCWDHFQELFGIPNHFVESHNRLDVFEPAEGTEDGGIHQKSTLNNPQWGVNTWKDKRAHQRPEIRMSKHQRRHPKNHYSNQTQVTQTGQWRGPWRTFNLGGNHGWQHHGRRNASFRPLQQPYSCSFDNIEIPAEKHESDRFYEFLWWCWAPLLPKTILTLEALIT